MKIQKLTNNIYTFQEDFLETRAGVILTKYGAIIIDTMYNKNSAKEILSFLKKKQNFVKLIIYTHGHGSHIYGAQILDKERKVNIIASKLCHQYMQEEFYHDLEENRKRDVNLEVKSPCYPQILFEKELIFEDGRLKLKLFKTPGHSDDSISIYLPEFGILFSGDAILAPNDVPFFEEGKSKLLLKTLNKLKKMEIKVIVPGHGAIGDKSLIEDNIYYIRSLRRQVKSMLLKKKNFKKIVNLPLETCIRKKFNLFWPDLHKWNVIKICNEFKRNPW